MKKAIFLATMMFASAGVFAMESTSGADKGRVKESVATSDPRKQVMREEFYQLMEAVESNNLDEVRKIIENYQDKSKTLDPLLYEKNKARLSKDQLEQVRRELYQNSYVTELVNLSNIKRNFPLLIAVKNGYGEIAKYLVDHGADVNKQYTFYETNMLENMVLKNVDFPLSIAVKNGYGEIAKYLVDHGADVNKEDIYKNTALIYAAQNGYKEIAKYLVDHRADVNKQDIHQNTALIYATKKGYKEIVEYLVDHGADVNKQDEYKNTALIFAAQNGYKEIVEHLVDHKADVNKANGLKKTSLIYAAQSGHIDIVKYLVDHGADVNKEDIYKNTALIYAAQSEHIDIVKYLVEKGSVIDIKKSLPESRLKIIEFLIDGVGVNKEDKHGITPLIYAAESGQIDIVKDLVKHGADVNKMNESGNNPLRIAMQKGYKDIVTNIIKSNADNKTYENGMTTLHLAAESGYIDIVKDLVDHGADVNKADSNGTTPLHLAAASRQENVIKYLVENGADVNSQNEAKKTALICAITGHANRTSVYDPDDDTKRIYKIVKYLLDKGADPNIGNSLQKAILYTKCHGDTRIMQCLINHGANVNGKGVLYEAIMGNGKGSFIATKLLLDNRADPTEELTKQRWTTKPMKELLEAYKPEKIKEQGIELTQEVINALQKEKKILWEQALRHGNDNLVEFFIKDGITKEEKDNYLSIAQKQLQNPRYNEEVKSQYKKIIEILKESDERKS